MPVNIYCDESGHLLHDSNNPIMALGALCCPLENTRNILDEIHNLKLESGFTADFEIKWTKVSSQKMDFYKKLIDYFYNNQYLNFRVLVADKRTLDHDRFKQSHDDWYYKMYYYMLENIIYSKETYYIYLDIKDTKSTKKAKYLKDVLSHTLYDFDGNIIKNIQHVRSHEIGIIQLTDLLTGATMHANKKNVLEKMVFSKAKEELIEYINKTCHISLTSSSLRRSKKFNVFVWRAR